MWNESGRFLVALALGWGLASAGAAPAQVPGAPFLFSTVEGEQNLDWFGRTVRSIGDVDGDGVNDAVISSRNLGLLQPVMGYVYIISGADGSLIRRIGGNVAFGWAADGAGDVDGDGTPDVIVGAPSGAGTMYGEALVFSGADGTLLHRLTRPGALLRFDGLGRAVCGIGDIDGDGRDDVVVTSPASSASLAGQGRVYLLSGLDGSVLTTFAPTPSSAVGSSFGWSVDSVGDLDGDMLPDVVVGTIFSAGAGIGAVDIYSSATGNVIHSFTGADRYGFSVAGIGDFDGDGVDDVGIGAPGDDDGQIQGDFGSVEVRSGADGSVLFSRVGALGDWLGYSVGRAGDVDRDGFADLLAGAPRGLFSFNPPPYLQVFSGVDGHELARMEADSRAASFGSSCDGMGDTNGDGIPDVIVGALNAAATGSASDRTGRAFIISACGAEPYLVGIEPQQTLTLRWNPDPAATTGRVEIAGAAAGGVGALMVGTRPTKVVLLCLTFVVDPASLIAGAPLVFDKAGGASFPLDIHEPALADFNSSFYLQAIELSPLAPDGGFASNGLKLHFCR